MIESRTLKSIQQCRRCGSEQLYKDYDFEMAVCDACGYRMGGAAFWEDGK